MHYLNNSLIGISINVGFFSFIWEFVIAPVLGIVIKMYNFEIKNAISKYWRMLWNKTGKKKDIDKGKVEDRSHKMNSPVVFKTSNGVEVVKEFYNENNKFFDYCYYIPNCNGVSAYVISMKEQFQTNLFIDSIVLQPGIHQSDNKIVACSGYKFTGFPSTLVEDREFFGKVKLYSCSELKYYVYGKSHDPVYPKVKIKGNVRVKVSLGNKSMKLISETNLNELAYLEPGANDITKITEMPLDEFNIDRLDRNQGTKDKVYVVKTEYTNLDIDEITGQISGQVQLISSENWKQLGMCNYDMSYTYFIGSFYGHAERISGVLLERDLNWMGVIDIECDMRIKNERYFIDKF